jgi:hypothetical protein
MPSPGIDSGTFAMEQAFIRYPHAEHVVIGADGILEQDYNTSYEYKFRNNMGTRREIYKRYRKTVFELLELYQPNCVFVSEHPDTQLRTATIDTFRK